MVSSFYVDYVFLFFHFKKSVQVVLLLKTIRASRES